MQDKNRHLSRQEMLLATEGELPPRRAAEVREHLSACYKCRSQMEAIRAMIADFMAVHRQGHHDEIDSQLPSAAISRARLEARLAEAARSSRLNPWTHFFRVTFGGHALAYISAVLLVIAIGTLVGYQRNMHRESEPAFAELDPAPAPNPSLTPGAVRPVTLKDICTEQASAEERTISISQQQRVFQEYGMANARPTDYEVDYLITPELGGADDIRNLWPEPHSSTQWNSYVKDDLENHLHQMVCEGKLDLATAQHDIATDWILAYKKYFQTDRPIVSHSDQNSEDRLRA